MFYVFNASLVNVYEQTDIVMSFPERRLINCQISYIFEGIKG